MNKSFSFCLSDTMFSRIFLVVLFLCVPICYCDNATEADISSSISSTDVSVTVTTGSSTEKPPNTSCDSHESCEQCIRDKQCYFCLSSKKCYQYKALKLIPTEECSWNSMYYLMCAINFKIFVILVGTAASIVFLIIICVCCYCCCKKKGSKLSKDEVKFARQREERKARAEERKKERASRTDEIRRKYGLMKEDNPYERFDA